VKTDEYQDASESNKSGKLHLQNTLRKLEEENIALQSKLDENDLKLNDYQEVQKTVYDLQKELLDYQEQCQTLQKQQKQNKRKIAKSDNIQAGEIKRDVAHWERRVSLLLKDIRNLRKNNLHKNDEITMLDLKHDQSCRQIKHLETQIEELKIQIRQAQNSISNETTKNEHANQELDELKLELNNQKSHHQNLRKIDSNLKKEIEKLARFETMHQNSLRNITHSNATIMRDLNSQINSLQHNLVTKKSDLANVEKKVIQKNGEIEGLNVDLKDLFREFEAKTNECRNHQSENQFLSMQLQNSKTFQEQSEQESRTPRKYQRRPSYNNPATETNNNNQI